MKILTLFLIEVYGSLTPLLYHQVFFCVMIGSFSLGQGAPNLESIAKARGAAYEVYKTIDMVQTFSLGSLQFILCNVSTLRFNKMMSLLHTGFSPVPLTAVPKKVTNWTV